MAILIKVQGGEDIFEIITDQCGTCEAFWHRSYIAGGCSEHHKQGEINIYTAKCDKWKLKPRYKPVVQAHAELIERG